MIALANELLFIEAELFALFCIYLYTIYMQTIWWMRGLPGKIQKSAEFSGIHFEWSALWCTMDGSPL